MNIAVGIGIAITNASDAGGPATGPSITTAPTVSSPVAQVGVLLTATPGTYAASGGGTVTVAGEWFVGGLQVATGQTYTPVTADAGKALAYVETATETGGTNDGSVAQNVNLSLVRQFGFVAAADPAVIKAHTGNLWMFYTDFDGANGTGRIKRAVSTDNGVTWSTSEVQLNGGGSGSAFENLETATIARHPTSGAYYLYTYGYTTAGLDASGQIFLSFGDGSAAGWSTPGLVIAKSTGGLEDIFAGEPSVIWTGSKFELVYFGASTGGANLIHTEASDGSSFVARDILTPTPPAGAFWVLPSTPDVISIPQGHLMAFTGVKTDLSNAGGIGLAFSPDGVNGTWQWGKNKVLSPAPGVSKIVGPALYYDQPNDTLHIWHTEVKDDVFYIGHQTMTLAAAFAAAGLTLPSSDTVITHEGVTYTLQGVVNKAAYADGPFQIEGPATVTAISGADFWQVNPQFNAAAQSLSDQFTNYSAAQKPALPFTLNAGDILVATRHQNPLPASKRDGVFAGVSALYARTSLDTGTRVSPAPFGWSGRGTPASYVIDPTTAVAAFPNKSTAGHTNLPAFSLLRDRLKKFNAGNAATSGANWASYGYESFSINLTASGTSQNYGEKFASVVNAAGLALASDAFTSAQKEELFIYLVRLGVHLYDAHKGAGVVQRGNGAHFQFNWLPVSLALQYTGRSAELATLETVYPTNQLAQAFVHTAATVADTVNPHSDTTKPNPSRLRPIDAVAGNTITVTEAGSPYYWNYSEMEIVRQSDGAKANIISHVSDRHLQGYFDIDAQPSPAFAPNDAVYFVPKWKPKAGWVDWRLTGSSAEWHEYIAGPRAPYRPQHKWADSVLALKALGVWHTSFDKVEKYTVLAQKGASEQYMYDYPGMTQNIDGGGNWAQEWWDSHAATVLDLSYQQQDAPSQTVDLSVGGSAKFAEYNNVVGSARVNPSKAAAYTLPMDPANQSNFFAAGEATFAIVRFPLAARRNVDLSAIWGVLGNDRDTWGFRLGLYDGAHGLTTDRHKFNGWYRGHGIGVGVDVFSAPWLGDEALVVFQRSGNDFTIDIYELGTGVKTAGPVVTKTPYLSGINVNGIGIGAVAAIDTSTKDVTGISGKAFPGEISMFGHVLPGASFTDAKWQNIAKGADPIAEFGGANFRWLRKLDGSDASLAKIAAVTSDTTGTMTKGLNGVGTDGGYPGSHLVRKTVATYLDVDRWPDGLVHGIHAGETTMPVTFSGKAGGLTGNVEMRTIYSATGSVHKDWTTVGAISGGAWSGVVQLPKSADGWLVAQFRATSDPADITDVREEFGIGYTVGWLGQSQVNNCAHSNNRNDVLAGLDNVTYVESLQTGSADATEGWKNAIYRGAPWQQSDGLTYFVRQLRRFDATTPIMVMNMAVSGSDLDALLDDLLTARKWARLQSKLDEFTNSVSAVVMNWGTAMNGYSFQKNKDLMEALVLGTGPEYTGNSLKNSLRAGWKFVLSPLTRHSDGTYNAPRRAQVEWANESNVKVSLPIPDYRIENPGGPHAATTSLKGNPLLGARLAAGVAQALGLTSITNPYYDVTNVTRSGNTITIPVVTPNGGTLSSPTPAALTNWQVNGSSTGFTAALSGSNVVLTKTSGNWSAGDTVIYNENGELRATGDGVAEDRIVDGVLYESWADDELSLGLPVVGSLSGGKWTPVFSAVVDVAAPTSIFDTANGMLLDIDNNLYTDTAGTTPVANDGDKVALWKSVVSGGIDMVQSDPTKRPIYRTGGGKPYLEFNGSSWMELSAGDLNYPTVSAHLMAKTFNGNVTVFGAPHVQNSHVSPYFRWSLWKRIADEIESRFNGTVTQMSPVGIATTETAIGFDTAAGTFYKDGSAQNPFTPVTITYPNATGPRLGANGAGGEVANMHFYGVLVADRQLTPAEISDTYTWLASLK